MLVETGYIGNKAKVKINKGGWTKGGNGGKKVRQGEKLK